MAKKSLIRKTERTIVGVAKSSAARVQKIAIKAATAAATAAAEAAVKAVMQSLMRLEGKPGGRGKRTKTVAGGTRRQLAHRTRGKKR